MTESWVTVYLPGNQYRQHVIAALNQIAKQLRLPPARPLSQPSQAVTKLFGGSVPKAVRVHPNVHAAWESRAARVSDLPGPLPAQTRRAATGRVNRGAK